MPGLLRRMGKPKYDVIWTDSTRTQFNVVDH